MEGSQMLRESNEREKNKKFPVKELKKLIIDGDHPKIIFWEGFDRSLLKDKKVVEFNKELVKTMEENDEVSWNDRENFRKREYEVFLWLLRKSKLQLRH